MNKLLPIFAAFVIFSCQEDEATTPVKEQPTSPQPTNPQPTETEIFKFDKKVSILNTHYYKGPDGKDYPAEAETFFKKTWTLYEDPSVKSIELKKDSIIINEELKTSKYKSTVEENNLYVADGSRKVLLGRIDKTTNSFYLFKHFESYAVVDTENGGAASGKSSSFGKITKDNIFPRIIDKPESLKQEGAYVFWNNVEYKFAK
ncbi:hypothetical protein HXZ62_02330 [Empedobacter falsenii]|uniref:hypothetical protein n=1 Tax=Empedobacter falsenii TaxID=343874 RepID=UPI0025756753|nr:hypothetical protein [Empedobacter falsenii]MDM1061397.1 hypothetical protein [Empedobacter falsenii]